MSATVKTSKEKFRSERHAQTPETYSAPLSGHVNL